MRCFEFIFIPNSIHSYFLFLRSPPRIHAGIAGVHTEHAHKQSNWPDTQTRLHVRHSTFPHGFGLQQRLKECTSKRRVKFKGNNGEQSENLERRQEKGEEGKEE